LRRNRLLHQAGDYAAFNFQPLPQRHLAASSIASSKRAN
jgi:hypothetical protein